MQKSALFLVYEADLVTQRRDTCSALRVFLFEKVLRVLEIEEGEPDWSRVKGSLGQHHFPKFTLKISRSVQTTDTG